MRITIVDDDKDICLLTKKLLVAHGHNVDAFHDPVSWILPAREIKPDLILMDIMLPGANGAEIVKSIQADPDFKDIPIIFLSSLVSGTGENTDEEGIIVGDIKYPSIGKPYEIEVLLKAIDKFA